jgi:hypothetical protein
MRTTVSVWRASTVPLRIAGRKLTSRDISAPRPALGHLGTFVVTFRHFSTHQSDSVRIRALSTTDANDVNLNKPQTLDEEEHGHEEFVPVVPRRTPTERAAYLRGVDELLKSVKESFDSPQPLPNFFLIRAWLKRRKRMTSAYRLYRFVQLQTNRDDIYDFMGFTERSAYQWFVLSTLHVWMVSCRLKLEQEAFDFYMEFADFFWQDVEGVLHFIDLDAISFSREWKKLPGVYINIAAALNKGLKGTESDFNDALFRFVFLNKLPEPLALPALQSYVRQQLDLLHKMDLPLLMHGYLPWVPFPPAAPTGCHQTTSPTTATTKTFTTQET